MIPFNSLKLLIYNITLKIDLDVHRELVSWIQATQLQVTGDAAAMPSRIYQLMDVDMSDGITYCLQHYFTDLPSYNDHRLGAGRVFQEELSAQFHDKFVIFTSLLSEV